MIKCQEICYLGDEDHLSLCGSSRSGRTRAYDLSKMPVSGGRHH